MQLSLDVERPLYVLVKSIAWDTITEASSYIILTHTDRTEVERIMQSDADFIAQHPMELHRIDAGMIVTYSVVKYVMIPPIVSDVFGMDPLLDLPVPFVPSEN